MSESTSLGYLVQSSKSALRNANPASLTARGLADLRSKGTAESIFRRAMMFRHDSTTGRKHRDECIRLLQQTLALSRGTLRRKPCSESHIPQDAALNKIK